MANLRSLGVEQEHGHTHICLFSFISPGLLFARENETLPKRMVTIDYENSCWILYLAKAQIPQSSEVILMFVLKGHRIQLFKRS